MRGNPRGNHEKFVSVPGSRLTLELFATGGAIVDPVAEFPPGLFHSIWVRIVAGHMRSESSQYGGGGAPRLSQAQHTNGGAGKLRIFHSFITQSK